MLLTYGCLCIIGIATLCCDVSEHSTSKLINGSRKYYAVALTCQSHLYQTRVMDTETTGNYNTSNNAP